MRGGVILRLLLGLFRGRPSYRAPAQMLDVCLLPSAIAFRKGFPGLSMLGMGIAVRGSASAAWTPAPRPCTRSHHYCLDKLISQKPRKKFASSWSPLALFYAFAGGEKPLRLACVMTKGTPVSSRRTAAHLNSPQDLARTVPEDTWLRPF